MSLYSGYADEDLEAEIADLKARIITAGKSTEAGVRVIAGEGRRVEFARGGSTSGNVDALTKLLASAEAEWNRRNGCSGGAIGVNF